MTRRLKDALKVIPTTLVKPCAKDEKTGCLYCSLLPWSPDFEKQFASAYQRNAEKILAKEPDGHVVESRRVSEAWDEVDILFVGEAPGAVEDQEGVPFIGRSGQLLRTTVEHYLADYSVGIANIIRCRPPRNRDPNKTELKSCSPELVREILARKPKVIVALGNFSLSFLTGQTGITSFSGKVLQCEREEFPDAKIVACLHPAYVQRFDHLLDDFIEAIEVARSCLSGEHIEKRSTGEYVTLTDLEDVRALFEAFAAEPDYPVSFDTETGHLKWWPKDFPPLLCLSFSNEAETGFTVPFDHEESPWCIGGDKENERDELIALLRAFFESDLPKRAQNGKFDANHIRQHIGVAPLNVLDTMATHLTIDETKGSHGLKRLAYGYTGMGGYERELEQYIAANKKANPELDGGSYANIPGWLLFPYAGADADCTVRVDEGMREDPEFVKHPRFARLSDHFFPALSDALADMEWNGAQIDPEIVKQLDKHHAAEMVRLAKEIQKLGPVRKFRKARKAEGKDDEFNPGSHEQLQDVLFDARYFGEKPVHLTKGGLNKLTYRYKVWVKKWRESKKGMEPVFQEVIKDAIKKRQWRHFSTDAEALQVLDERGNPLAELIVEYRAHATLHGTFVKPLMDELDVFGRIHGSFLLWGTVTGRLASRGPNLQNIPNKDSGEALAIKKAYVSRFGDEGVLLQGDYSQVELRIAASIFKESAMLKAYRNGEDVHEQTALMISGKSKGQYGKFNDHDKKQWRTRAKRINFGILYGGGPGALVKTLKKDGIFITFEEAARLIELYFKKRPELRRGIERLENEVRRTGFLESFTGRHRRVPEVRSEDDQLVSRALRQSINFPVQSGASDMTLMALVLIWREMKKRGLRSVLILTVHDSIIADCHVDEVEEVARLMKDIMENLPELSEQVLPGVDWSWLICPIIADMEVGTTWGTLVEWKLDDYEIDEVWARIVAKAEAA